MLGNTIRAVLVATVIASAGAVAAPAFADKSPVYKEAFSNVGVKGYDPVAYFTDNHPVMGSDKFKATYNGAEFHFATAANRDAFLKEPAKYAPQYGGYCAWAAAQGKTAPGDPNEWRIVDGKLYLNFNHEVQQRWEKDIPGNISKANSNWPRILK